MTVSSSQIVKASTRLINVQALAVACDRHRLPFYLGCTILEMETAGRNIFGHDRGGALADPDGKNIEVTEARFKKFLDLIRSGHTSNGVGPMQITFPGFFPQMEQQQLKAWVPADNIMFGVSILAKTWTASQSVRKTAKAYNGGDSYAATAVERAKANPALHEAAVARRGLPADLLNEMYFVVEARLRQRILEQNAAMDPALLESALAAGRARIATVDGALPADYAESLAYVEELKAAGQLTPQMLARFLRSGGKTSFIIALAQLSDVDFHTAAQIIERRELDALAVICRAADLDRAIFLTYAVVLLNTEGDAMGKAHGYARMYADLTRDAAMRTLRFWRMRRGVQAA